MWLMLSDAFFSIVRKNCKRGELLVRARRAGDIEKVFGRRHEVTRDTDADYLYRACILQADVAEVLERELQNIDYGNFKDTVHDPELHHAYMGVWSNMAAVQHPRPYSTQNWKKHGSPVQKALRKMEGKNAKKT